MKVYSGYEKFGVIKRGEFIFMFMPILFIEITEKLWCNGRSFDKIIIRNSLKRVRSYRSINKRRDLDFQKVLDCGHLGLTESDERLFKIKFFKDIPVSMILREINKSISVEICIKYLEKEKEK
jgi:hypothetical protein